MKNNNSDKNRLGIWPSIKKIKTVMFVFTDNSMEN